MNSSIGWKFRHRRIKSDLKQVSPCARVQDWNIKDLRNKRVKVGEPQMMTQEQLNRIYLSRSYNKLNSNKHLLQSQSNLSFYRQKDVWSELWAEAKKIQQQFEIKNNNIEKHAYIYSGKIKLVMQTLKKVEKCKSPFSTIISKIIDCLKQILLQQQENCCDEIQKKYNDANLLNLQLLQKVKGLSEQNIILQKKHQINKEKHRNLKLFHQKSNFKEINQESLINELVVKSNLISELKMQISILRDKCLNLIKVMSALRTQGIDVKKIYQSYNKEGSEQLMRTLTYFNIPHQSLNEDNESLTSDEDSIEVKKVQKRPSIIPRLNLTNIHGQTFDFLNEFKTKQEESNWRD